MGSSSVQYNRITELPSSFFWPAPKIDPLCMKHAMSNLLQLYTGSHSGITFHHTRF